MASGSGMQCMLYGDGGEGEEERKKNLLHVDPKKKKELFSLFLLFEVSSSAALQWFWVLPASQNPPSPFLGR